jgi:two-component system sensor histidine kinase DegS
MSSDQQAQHKINRLYISVSLYRTRKRKQTEVNTQIDQVNREIDDLIRQKVVRQLHDGLSQTVSALAMRVNFARRLMEEDPIAAHKELEKVEGLARDTTREIRSLIFTLRPTSTGSNFLIESLGLLVEKMDELFDLEIDLDMDENLVNQLPIIDQKIIYYLVEEAIGSARKRNGSTHLTLILTKHDTQVAQLMIEDCADTAKKMEFPFQSAEMDNIQEFSELIGGSVGVLGGGPKIQVLFPLSRQPGDGIKPQL